MTRRIEILNDNNDNSVVILTQDPYCIVSADREDLDNISGFVEVDQPGVYILSNDDGRKIYVGQARSGTYKRLRQHNKDIEKDWFTKITIISKVGYPISSEQLNYIEKRMISIAGETGAEVTNKTIGNSSVLSPFKKSQADSFIDDAVVLLDTFFDILPSNLPIMSRIELSVPFNSYHKNDNFDELMSIVPALETEPHEKENKNSNVDESIIYDDIEKSSVSNKNQTNSESNMISSYYDYLTLSDDNTTHEQYNSHEEDRYEGQNESNVFSQWFRKRIIGE